MPKDLLSQEASFAGIAAKPASSAATKRWTWEPGFKTTTRQGATLTEFHNVELIITDSGVAAIGGTYKNVGGIPDPGPVLLVLQTAGGTDLIAFDEFLQAILQKCDTEVPFNWTGSYDSTQYELARSAAARVGNLRYKPC